MWKKGQKNTKINLKNEKNTTLIYLKRNVSVTGAIGWWSTAESTAYFFSATYNKKTAALQTIRLGLSLKSNEPSVQWWNPPDTALSSIFIPLLTSFAQQLSRNSQKSGVL